MEEPETYISPAAQAELIDLIAIMCVKKDVSVIFTTHSPAMFSRLSQEQVTFFYRDIQGSRIAAEDQFEAMRILVGLKGSVDIAVLVEDRAAREFARLLLQKCDLSLASRSEIVDVGGEAVITSLRRQVPRRLKAMTIVGLYDGDVRESIRSTEGEWPLLFLPGDHSVESLFRNMASSSRSMLAERLGMSEQNLAIALSGLAGSDSHDWFENLAKAIGISYDQLMMACFEAWLAVEGNGVAAEAVLTALRKAV